jgi:geranylgeranyl reductase family protein
MKVTIIGAGPAGCYTAYLLAKQGIDVEVYEEHASIGKPLHCAGIVTASIKKIIDIPESIILNSIHKASIHAPNGRYIEFNLKNPNLILDRIKFDQGLGLKARDAGAKFFFNHVFLDFRNREAVIKNKGIIKKTKTDYLIGADGPSSAVAKSIGKFKKRRFWQGIQARIRLKNSNIVEFFPYIGSFAWIIPENKNTARIGLLAKKDAAAIFKKFLHDKAPQAKIIDRQAGLVPYYNARMKTQKGRVFLVGDAAAQVKATSGGGIIQGLIASQCVTKAIAEHKNYEKLWKNKLAVDLWVHLRLRKIMDKFSNKDYNYLTYLVNQRKIRNILEKFDRDSPKEFLIKMLLKEPRFLLFARKLF